MCVHLSDGETAIKEAGGTGDKIGSLRRQINGGFRTLFGRPKTTGWGRCDYFFVERHCFQGCHHVLSANPEGDHIRFTANYQFGEFMSQIRGDPRSPSKSTPVSAW